MVSSPKVKEIVDIYNAAMGLIGLKNLGQSGYKSVKNLLKFGEDKDLKQTFKEYYISFKSKLSHSKALGEYDELGMSTKNILKKQEQILEEFAKGINVEKRVFTQREIDMYVAKSTKNKDKDRVLLGKYIENSPTSYEKRAELENYTFFQLDDWNEVYKIAKSDDEMWKINKEFIRKQRELNKEFFLSHNPFDSKYKRGFYEKEVNYLTTPINQGGLGGRITQINQNLWKVVW